MGRQRRVARDGGWSDEPTGRGAGLHRLGRRARRRPGLPPGRGRRGHRRLRGRSHPQRDRLALEGRPARGPAARVPRPGGPDGAAAPVSGVGPDTTVVLYGGNNNWFATYAYWLLRYLGFDRVKLVDGGRKKWELEDRELVTDEPAYDAADPGPLGAGARGRAAPSATTCSPTSAARAGRWWTCAARPSSRGEVLAPPHLPQEQAQVPGHIPGAANVPWATAAPTTARSRATQELTALYGGVGRHARHRRDRVLPHRRALEPHLVRAARAARLRPGCATTTAPGPSTAASSASPSSGEHPVDSAG